jgi:starch synthase
VSLRILYVATDQRVPGAHGGAVHVAAVADGLAALGHEVHVLAAPGAGPFPRAAAHWHALGPPLGLRQLRWMRARAVIAFSRRLQPDVVIERYYNFGGEGVLAARATGALAVLEVNAPIIDHPGSLKPWLDRALLVQPMRRWREWQVRCADLLVTPDAAIVPVWARDRVVEIEWGADTERFRPDATGPVPFARRPEETVVVFSGAFRPWHGAIHLVEAVRRLERRGRRGIRAILIGDGPERRRVERAARGLAAVTVMGPVAHEGMPACLAAADVGVAPFDASAHGPLRLGFYWSPLKIFEYMAAGLPVVAPDLERLRRLVRHEREGLLYDPNDPDGLADAIELLTDASERARLGRAARERVVREFGWDVHCRRLAAAIVAARDARRARFPS